MQLHLYPLLRLLMLLEVVRGASCSSARSIRELLAKQRRVGDYFAPNNCHDHVALLKQPGDRANICSGVLVSPDWILTDAHCVDFRRMSSAMRRPVVHLGGIRMRGSFEEIHSIDEVRFHPMYDGNLSSPFNVALLRLQIPSNMAPVRLWQDKDSLDEALLHVVGWGRVGAQGPLENRLLQTGKLVLLPGDECASNGVPQGMDCFATTAAEACTGVGGASIVASPRSSCKNHILLGLLKHGCISAQEPQGFMSMKNLAEWVTETTEQESDIKPMDDDDDDDDRDDDDDDDRDDDDDDDDD